MLVFAADTLAHKMELSHGSFSVQHTGFELIPASKINLLSTKEEQESGSDKLQLVKQYNDSVYWQHCARCMDDTNHPLPNPYSPCRSLTLSTQLQVHQTLI